MNGGKNTVVRFLAVSLVVFSITACTDQLQSPTEAQPTTEPEVLAADPALSAQVSAGTFTLAFAMALGGSAANEMIRDVATDAAGNIYVTGGTNARDFPVTAGAYDVTFNNGATSAQDVFVAKFSPTGQLLWATFIGGPGYDRAYALEVDAQGFVYVAGRAGTGFPVTANALQRTFAGGDAGQYGTQDGFVCKLRPNGDALVFCTYFGNQDIGVIRDIALDASNNVYLVTSASVGSFPAAWFSGRHQPTRRGGRDVLIAKLAATGSSVLWATWLGGSGEEMNTSTIRVDQNGNVLALINTRSADMRTPNGFDRTRGGVSDVYLGKLSPDGARLIFGTYVGGSGNEGTETHQLWVTSAGHSIVTGMTTSTDFPTTATAFQRKFGGSGGAGTGAGTNYSGDGFVTKISATGALLASTYIGSARGDGAEGVGVDNSGNIHVAGSTYSPAFPTTVPPIGVTGKADIFGVVFSQDLSQLLYGFKAGGSGDDTSRSAFVDAAGSGFLVGGIASSNFPVRNAPAYLNGSGQNGALVKISHY